MDLITQLPKTATGYDAIVVFVDRLTKMIHLAPTMTTVDAPGTAKLFFDHVVRQHGMPLAIVSDRDPRFTSTFWKSLFELTGTRLAMSTANHPQTDGQTERANRTIEEMLRAYVHYSLTDWDQFLAGVEYAYNDSKQKSTGFTPFYLNYGRNPHTPLSLLQAHAAASGSPSAEEFISRAREALARAKTNLGIAQARQEKEANSRRRSDVFKVGDQVLVSTSAISPPGRPKVASKLQPQFYGPFAVEAVISPVAYRIALPAHIKAHPVIYIGALRRHKTDGRPQKGPPPLGQDSDGEDLWEVEKILDYKEEDGVGKYLVKWVGYADSENTWEPAADLRHLAAAKRFEGKTPRGKR